MEEEKIPPLGAPGFVVSDNAGCFTAPALTKYMKIKGTECRTALPYDPLSNGRGGSMVPTITRSISPIKHSGGNSWDGLAGKEVFEYRRRGMKDGQSPLYMLYAVKPRFIWSDEVDLDKPPSSNARAVQYLLVTVRPVFTINFCLVL